MKRLMNTVAVLLLLVLAGGLAARWYWRRALPVVSGTRTGTGIGHRAEVIRDRWGVPHIFAEDDADAYFALGWTVSQDRLFQLELLRRLSQGRLAEMFGPSVLNLDKLFRTMGFHRTGQRLLARARPEARAAAEAYCRGVNAYVQSLGGSLPIEFALLGRGFDPVREDEFVGILGYMAWGLNASWTFDPLYEQLVAKVGPERAAELFPYNNGGSPSVYPETKAMKLSLFHLSDEEERLLDVLPQMRASNNWVVGPQKSLSGQPILANDPHLGHGIPGVWYQAHLKTKTQDVIGVTIPGFPAVVIGHNRDIAWGFTNLMLDAADFFVEKLDPARPGEVMYKNEWVKIEAREEVILVKGQDAVKLPVRSTPHGPLVSDFFPDQKQALSYRWNHFAAEQANEVDGFYDLDRARNWDEFRGALRQFGAVAQNVAYADKDGHIGMQAAGAIPRLKGAREGTRFRTGWDGSQEWDGFVPFEEHPVAFDPPSGWLASANNPTVPSPAPYYISSQWEPMDRYQRIAGLLTAEAKLSREDMRLIQMDDTWVSAQELTPAILEAFAASAPADQRTRTAVALLQSWDGEMRVDSPAPAIFAAFYKQLFHELFADEIGTELAKGYRSKANLSATMIRTVMNGGPQHWLDRVDTPAVEGKPEVIRNALVKATDELAAALGGDPKQWTWGRLHTLEFQHPMGRGSKLLARLFNLGPFPIPGHAATINKAEYPEADFRVVHGPSMRQITDFADLNKAVGIIPTGQSGIAASPHYSDLMPLWLSGQYHPLLLDRAEIEKVAEARLTLGP